MDPRNDWVARIMQIRADGSPQVFALVAWLYWPDHLYTAWTKGEQAKNGRKGYHGDYELVASNHLDIIDVHTFDNNINHLLEKDDEDLSREGQIKECYWRQTYDYRTGELSVSRHPSCSHGVSRAAPLLGRSYVTTTRVTHGASSPFQTF